MSMGYNHIIRVASDSSDIDWHEFRKHYLHKFGNSKHVIGKVRQCEWVYNPDQFLADVSTAFPTIHFRFYCFQYDCELLIIIDYHEGDILQKTYCHPPQEFCKAHGLSYDGFLWNHETAIDKEITKYFIAIDDCDVSSESRCSETGDSSDDTDLSADLSTD